MFTLTEAHLQQLVAINRFEMPGDEMLFFGIRGALPVHDSHHDFADRHDLVLTTVDHVFPRCTLGQWRPGQGFAVYPGSTVPHQSVVKKALARGGAGANRVMTGWHKNYAKGKHPLTRPATQHDAFRNDGKLPIRRTADDLDYDNDDRVEYTVPCDNLHAAWCASTDIPSFASAGCQVVLGFPSCPKRNHQPATGPWKHFQETAYAVPQQRFEYMLLNGRDYHAVANGAGSTMRRLRFGSQGDEVKALQQKLKDAQHYRGQIDGDFGRGTLFALLAFQEDSFGDGGDDGVVGPQTRSALGLS